MQTTLILLVAAGFLGMGAVAIIRPAFVVGLFGTTSLTRDGNNEVRAVYGGFGLAVAALLAATPWVPSMRSGALLAVGVSLGGMAGGRVISALIDGLPGPMPRLIICVELAMMAALLWAR